MAYYFLDHPVYCDFACRVRSVQLSTVKTADAGVYTLRAQNSVGDVSTCATLTVTHGLQLLSLSISVGISQA